MGIELILEKATNEQAQNAVRNSHFEILLRQGYELYFGSQIGEYRNRYWREPKNGKFVIDYVYNLVDIAGDLIGRLSLLKTNVHSIDKKQRRDRLLMKATGHLNQLLSENLAMYEQGKTDSESSVLDISNKAILDDINRLRSGAFVLNSAPVGSPEFFRKITELKTAYLNLILKYPI